jgi:hypothetical protein
MRCLTPGALPPAAGTAGAHAADRCVSARSISASFGNSADRLASWWMPREHGSIASVAGGIAHVDLNETLTGRKQKDRRQWISAEAELSNCDFLEGLAPTRPRAC